MVVVKGKSGSIHHKGQRSPRTLTRGDSSCHSPPSKQTVFSVHFSLHHYENMGVCCQNWEMVFNKGIKTPLTDQLTRTQNCPIGAQWWSRENKLGVNAKLENRFMFFTFLSVNLSSWLTLAERYKVCTVQIMLPADLTPIGNQRQLTIADLSSSPHLDLEQHQLG